MKSEELRARRIKLRCSQYVVAKIAGISRNRLSLIECCYADGSSEEIEKIQAALIKIEEEIVRSCFCKGALPMTI